MSSRLMPDRLDDADVLDAWKVRRDMALEEQARDREKEKSTAAAVD